MFSDQIWPKVTQQGFPGEPPGLQLYNGSKYFTMAWVLFTYIHNLIQLHHHNISLILLQDFKGVRDYICPLIDTKFLDEDDEVYREVTDPNRAATLWENQDYTQLSRPPPPYGYIRSLLQVPMVSEAYAFICCSRQQPFLKI